MWSRAPSRRRALGLTTTVWLSIAACGRSDLFEPPYETLDASADSPTPDDVSSDDGSELDSPVFGFDSPGAPPDAPPPPGCDSKCFGCCLNDVCIGLGVETADMCGFAGNACESCGPNGSCFKGVCSHPQPDCGPSNCTGCCLDANHCSDGISADACGYGGHECQGCGPIQSLMTCVPQDGGGGNCQPTCGPDDCPGCCDGTACLLGQSDSSCGTMGQPCIACPQGEACMVQGPGRGGLCKVPCSPATCNGCCDGDVCAVGNQDIACGTGGEACADCTAMHYTCISATCMP